MSGDPQHRAKYEGVLPANSMHSVDGRGRWEVGDFGLYGRTVSVVKYALIELEN